MEHQTLNQEDIKIAVNEVFDDQTLEKFSDEELNSLAQSIKRRHGRRQQENSTQKRFDNLVTRRDFLKKAGLGAGSIGLLSLLPSAAAKLSLRDNIDTFGTIDTNGNSITDSTGGPVEVNADTVDGVEASNLGGGPEVNVSEKAPFSAQKGDIWYPVQYAKNVLTISDQVSQLCGDIALTSNTVVIQDNDVFPREHTYYSLHDGTKIHTGRGNQLYTSYGKIFTSGRYNTSFNATPTTGESGRSIENFDTYEINDVAFEAGSVYFANELANEDKGGQVAAIEPPLERGSTWSKRLPNRQRGVDASATDVVTVDQGGIINCFNRNNGNNNWSSSISNGQFRGGVFVHNDVAYATVYDYTPASRSRVVAYDMDSGIERFSIPMSAQDGYPQDVHIHQGVLVVAVDDSIEAFDLSSQTRIWKATKPQNLNDIEVTSGIVIAPEATDKNENQSIQGVYGFDIRTGNLLWWRGAWGAITSGVSVHGSRAAYAVNGRGIEVIEPASFGNKHVYTGNKWVAVEQ